MPPSFVVDFSALLLLGPDATMLVAAAGAVVHGLTDSEVPHRLRRTLFTAATVVAAAQATGLVHQVSGGTIGNFVWPAQGVPIALAVIAYCVVTSASAELVVPLLTRQPINRSWPASMLRGAPLYLIGASIAVCLVMIVNHRTWEVVPVVVAPLYFVYRAYCAHVIRLDEEHQRRQIDGSLHQGMAVIDSSGVITLWSDGLARMVGCPRERAVGRALAAVPALGKTSLPRLIADALAGGTARTTALFLMGNI